MKRIALIIILVYSCNSIEESSVTGDDGIQGNDLSTIWDISTENLKEGAPYTLINDPKFKNVDESSLDENEEVVMIKGNEGVKAYPLRYVNFSEVVNDTIDELPIAITNCPQTKSSICFVRFSDDASFDLKASGYLYHDNQVYTNSSESVFWSQMLLEKIRGDNQYKVAKTYPLLKTSWSTVQRFYPQATVYYREENKQLPRKTNTERKAGLKLGIIDNSKFENHLYLFSKTQQFSIQNHQGLVYVNEAYNLKTTFKLPTTEVEMVDDFPNVFKDREGNTWDVFGFCTSGSRFGEKLIPFIFYEAEEWAWKSFFETIIHVD